jgi:serpin B
MAKTLHFDLPQNQLHPAFAALNNTLNPKDKPYELSMANRLWGQQGYEFLPAFLQTTRDYYAAELAQVDFVNAAEAVRQEINEWVEEKTNDKIKDLIPQNVLDEMTRLVLTNAIYFKGDWASQFDEKATRDAPFSASSDNKVTVPMMYQKGKFKYGEFDEIQVLELPYKSGDLSMLVLLPKAVDGLPALEAKLTTENLNKWTSDLSKREIDVYLPKFKMTSQFRLKDVLSSMGMPSAFDPMVADFSGMNGKTDLYISAVIHKAFVDVNEEGTEAAAATAVVVAEDPSVQIIPTFRADHPFIFLIRDNRTGSILFIGRVTNPEA